MFFAFSGENYYPAGGAFDCVGVFDTLDMAREAAMAELKKSARGCSYPQNSWAHVAEIKNGDLVATWDARRPECKWKPWPEPKEA